MWTFLYRLASPRQFYQWTTSWLPWLAWMAFALLSIGLVWGLIFAPADYQQQDAFRIIYIHVPAAFLSLFIYAGMGFLAMLVMVWRIKLAGIVLRAAAQLGTCMTFIALVTGSIWGKPMWGAWWVWDARLTSELILLLLYVALLAVAYAYENKDQGDRVLAVLTLVGVLDLPIIHYSVYWWNTLHQGATLSLFNKPKIAPSMLYPLLISLLGFLLYCAWLIILKVRQDLLHRSQHQQWVQTMIKAGIE